MYSPEHLEIVKVPMLRKVSIRTARLVNDDIIFVKFLENGSRPSSSNVTRIDEDVDFIFGVCQP
jgi:hypothetical protein